MDHLTTDLLQFTQMQWRMAGGFTSGGKPIFGAAQTRRSDGGGLWQATGQVILTTDDEVRLWEALLTDWNLGNTGMVVHRNSGPLLLSAGGGLVPFSDGSTFSDGTLFLGGDVEAELVDAVEAGDVTYRIRIAAPRALRGAEPFTLVGTKYLDRLHGVARILASEADGEAVIYTVRAGPPLSEDFPAGTPVDFNLPRCFMRVDMSDPAIWPTYEGDFTGASIPVTFDETMDVPS